MKKKILLLCFAFLSFISMQAQNPFFVGGYVTDLNGGAIANHTVYIISDSNSMIPFVATTNTNANGYYSFTNVTVPAPGLTTFYIVSTYDCNGVVHSSTVSNANPQNVVNFSICYSNTLNCNAMFTALFTSGNTVNFNDLSTGNPVSWYWNFGDGTSSTLQNPSHSYTLNGAVVVCLTITTANNCTSTYCDTIFVQGGSTNNCNASFIAYPDSLAGLNTLHFLNTSSSTYANYQIVYLWNFGDGTTSSAMNPTHTFSPNSSGVYNVCLTMKVLASNNTIVCTNTFCQNVTVGTSGTGCQNTITYINQGNLFTFTGSVNSNNPTTYYWNFGDGTSATGQNATHTFAPPSSGVNGYNVCLYTVTTNTNTGTTCSDSSCQFVIINNNTNSCNASFVAYPDSLTGLNIFHFTNTSTTTYLNYQMLYLWNFGDGTTSTLQNPIHTFAYNPSTANVYNVCLTMKVVNALGTVICTDYYCQSITVGNSGNACSNSFTFTHQNLNYAFSGIINSGNPTTYNWNFGDGTTATGQYVTHTFTQPAAGSIGYTVCLITITSNNNGTVCTDTTCQFVTVNNTNGNVIQGYVYAGNYVVSNGYVLVYQANNATMSYVLVDTLALDSNGFFQFFYLNMPPTTPAFLIKAALNSTASNYSQFAPTFYQNTINWFTATPVFPSASTVFYNIYMIQMPTPSAGNGSVTGNVSQIGTKGDFPLSDIELILTDENDSPIKINYSDASGNFSFTNLSMGTYKLHVEIAGVNYTPFPVILSSTNPNITNISVNVNNNGAIITGIENEVNNKSSISEIYPNPATSEAFIEIKNSRTDKIIISVFDNTGIRVSTEEYVVSGSRILNLNKEELSSGIYTVKIQTSNGFNSIRKLVISK